MNRDVAICGNCLRVWPAHPTNEGKCEKCGGDTCSCLGCMSVLENLERGRYLSISGILGAQVTIVGWSRDGGGVFEDKATEAMIQAFKLYAYGDTKGAVIELERMDEPTLSKFTVATSELFRRARIAARKFHELAEWPEIWLEGDDKKGDPWQFGVGLRDDSEILTIITPDSETLTGGQYGG